MFRQTHKGNIDHRTNWQRRWDLNPAVCPSVWVAAAVQADWPRTAHDWQEDGDVKKKKKRHEVGCYSCRIEFHPFSRSRAISQKKKISFTGLMPSFKTGFKLSVFWKYAKENVHNILYTNQTLANLRLQ